MRHLLIAAFAAFASVFGGMPAFAGDVVLEDYNLKVVTPPGVTFVRQEAFPQWGMEKVWLRADGATITIFAWTYDRASARTPNAQAWAGSMIAELRDPKLGEWYNEGAPTSLTPVSTSSIPLGTGEGATLLEATATINGYHRNVGLIAFERQSGSERHWFVYFAGNSGKQSDLTGLLNALARATGYIVPPKTAAIN